MYQGSMVALATPMLDDGSDESDVSSAISSAVSCAIDQPALAELIEFHIAAGTDAIVAVGTTGESATLTVPEHTSVIKQVVELVNKRVPVIAGTGANSTAEAIELTSHAVEAGADACLLVTPYYNKPTQEGLYRHFQAIAQAVDIPQILYNVPGRTSVDMQVATTARLSNISNIVGIKEAFGTVERIKELVNACADDFMVVTGDDGTAMESILAGAKGNISVTANVVPELMHKMCAAALEGDRSAAQKLDAQMVDLHTSLFLESNPIPVKWALQQMGKLGPGIRLPLTPLAAEFHDTVRAALTKAGAL